MSDQWPNQWQPGQFGPGDPYGGNPYGAPGLPPGTPYQQYPQPAGYGVPMPSAPSSTTAIIAAVLSLLGALATGSQAVTGWAFLGAMNTVNVKIPDESPSSGVLAIMTVSATVLTLVAVALLVGGVLLLMGRLAGRMVVIASCAAVVLISLVNLVVTLALINRLNDTVGSEYASVTHSYTGISVVAGLVPMLFAIGTAVLAANRSTREWCQWKSATAAPAGYPGYAQPGYLQSGYPQPGYPPQNPPQTPPPGYPQQY
ncbi:MAG: hypothetical protein P4L86_25995 [Mycobacterium sp.]|nr:hypothetical protein [Mycobacterium sp.]